MPKKPSPKVQLPNKRLRTTLRDHKSPHSETVLLQGAYFIIAARALGLDCGPMSGFDNALVDEEFFAGTTFRSNFLCNLGYGDASATFKRLPRHECNDVCEVF